VKKSFRRRFSLKDANSSSDTNAEFSTEKISFLATAFIKLVVLSTCYISNYTGNDINFIYILIIKLILSYYLPLSLIVVIHSLF